MRAGPGPGHAPLAVPLRAQARLQHPTDADALPGRSVSQAAGALPDQSPWLQTRGCLPRTSAASSAGEHSVFLPPPVT